MSDIDALKKDVNMKTWQLLLLTLVTVGIYNLVWIFTTTNKIQRHTGIKVVGQPFLLVMSVCFAWAGVFSESSYFLVALLSLAISLSLLTLYEVWAFKVRKALQEVALVEHQQVYKMNVIYTFLFTLYYINYCINDLPKQLEKQKADINASL
ncbi:hypothetical protein MSP8887_03425 [Marinomonas spartinae]|uniref:DUF4234 domain-containing protein n=2 Tax=Marinomonas spartinae TaxID=1792290 RepID=A0A1A8TQR8_9GAMM|nr:DUF4234 domain-containing protein [Marinomonas spartinae]SBS36753.1 hypothetical protein MSP8886_03834 [Marinomonas spartinae]SBS38663.1 hypothetical protein MSP8887_03425 [Marinomonas spartinae]